MGSISLFRECTAFPSFLQKTRADLEECMIYLRRRTHEFLSFLGLWDLRHSSRGDIYAVSYTTSHSLEMIYCGSANHLGRFLLCYSACRSSALHFML